MSESAETSHVDASCVYSVDDDDIVTFVGDSWMRFAERNGAPELTREAVLGHSLWEFVAGEDTCAVYRLLFEWVREHQARLSLPFRCDAPSERREMQLHIEHAHGGIELHADLLAARSHRDLAILSSIGERSTQRLLMCSFCKRIFAAGRWLDAFDALTRLDLADSHERPRIEYRVCEECRRMCARASLARRH